MRMKDVRRELRHRMGRKERERTVWKGYVLQLGWWSKKVATLVQAQTELDKGTPSLAEVSQK